jgi:hypothetical protein
MAAKRLQSLSAPLAHVRGDGGVKWRGRGCTRRGGYFFSTLVGAHRMLTAEELAVELAATEMPPEHRLGGRRIVAVLP